MSWAHYILQVNIYLIVFYGFYKLLLDKETYFLLNRIYLVSAGVLSLAIPFLRFEWFTTQPAAQPVYTGVVQINDFITQMGIVKNAPDKFSIGSILVILYLAGILFFIVRFIVQLISVQILLKKKKSGSAFSFFKKNVIDKSLPQIQTIEKHEEIHIRQWHTLDVLFFELLGILTWFNPVIYLYKRTVKHIHEYLADEEAAIFQGDKEEYALLLLSSAFGVSPNTLTNSFFNKSLIKKRIYMLHKQRSRKTAMLKYGLFVPLFAVTLTMSSATIRNNEKIKEFAKEIPLEQPLNIVKEALGATSKVPIERSSNNFVLAKTPSDSAVAGKTSNIKADTDWADFFNHIKRAIRYPSEAQKSNVQGYSQIKFTVKNGSAEEVSIATSLGAGCDTEVMKAILSYSKFKNIPDGKYTFNTLFKLSSDIAAEPDAVLKNQDLSAVEGYDSLAEVVVVGYASKSNSSPSSSSGEKVYDFVSLDKQPTFPGGMAKFYEYLKKTVKYPKEAQEKNIQGKVFLSFVVETDGKLTDIHVDRRLGGGTDEEAVRVMEASPNWIPGEQGGQKVRVKYNIPLSFSLSKDEGTKGKSTGINVTDKNSKLNIGGGTKALIIVDGKKIKNEDLNQINPNNVASVEVLKQASATALYGDEAKEGVILITTKVQESTNKSGTKKTETSEKNKPY